MTKPQAALFAFMACLVAMSPIGGAKAEQQVAMPYSVKTSDVLVPDDVPMGQYRRTIRPFGNWTLFCDENLKQKQRVCNISQSLVDHTGAVAFSWSLAATREGKPMMILRANRSVGAGKPIEVAFLDGKGTLATKTTDCDARICMAMLPVDARLKVRIEAGALAEISYDVTTDGPGGSPATKVFFRAPLQDLAAALAAL